MGRILTNDVGLQYAKESSVGTLPASPEWKLLEPNNFPGFGATVTTVARSPISPNRQRRKGTITDLDSQATFEQDLTLSAFLDFVEGFIFARAQEGATAEMEWKPTAVTSGGSGGYTIPTSDYVTVVAVSTGNVALATGLENGDTLDGVTLATGNLVLLVAQSAPAENGAYTVVASGAASRATAYDTAAELAGVSFRAAGGSANAHKVYKNTQLAADITLGTTSIVYTAYPAVVAGTLVYARGFAESANNGLKQVQSGSTSVNVRVNSLTAETVGSTQNASIEVAGVISAAGDLDINSSGNITSTTLDFTTLGLYVGQFIWVGGDAALNKFSTAANSGLARIAAISANLLTLDKKTNTFVTEANTTQEVWLLWGRFIKNVTRSNAKYYEQSFQFEASYPNGMLTGATGYEYSKGNYCNTMTITLPLTEKATVEFGFVGTDTETMTATRKTNASSPKAVVRRDAFNTTPDVLRLRVTQVDETGMTTDFKNITLILNNNVSPEKVIGTLGARYMNTGQFEVNLDANVLFTSEGVPTAIRANTTVTMEMILKNEDGAIALDIPALTLGGGAKDFPVNESVQLQMTGEAFEHPVLGTSIGVTVFPYLPAS